MIGKSQICDGDVLDALSTSLEPRFRASAILSAESTVVKFLLERGMLLKGYESTVLCDRCEERCEVEVQAENDRRFFICPTGFIERPVSVTEDDVSCYRFDFASLCACIVRENNLKSWDDRSNIGQPFSSVANGRKLNLTVAVIYGPYLASNVVLSVLATQKARIGCDVLIVLTAKVDQNKALDGVLAAEGIILATLAELLNRRSFNFNLEKNEMLFEIAVKELDDEAWYPHVRLAEVAGVGKEALRKRLDRFRKTSLDGWKENEDRRSREVKYHFQFKVVKDILKELWASSERPAK